MNEPNREILPVLFQSIKIEFRVREYLLRLIR